MEQYHFSYQQVYPQDIDKGDLRSKYDVILFISDGIPAFGTNPAARRNREPEAETIPAAYRHMLGSLTAEHSVARLKEFMEKGGDIVTVGSATNLAYHLKLPVENALSKVKADQFYIPGSILRVNVDTLQQANYGIPAQVDVVFNNSPVFLLPEQAKAQFIIPLAWFDQQDALRSGWAWGQKHLKGGVAAFVAPIGKGKLYAFGPEITFRAQAHGTFKMLFNQLYTSKSK